MRSRCGVVLLADESVELWDGPRGKRIRELPKLPFYYHHSNGEWRGIDMTRDGKRLALIHRNASGNARDLVLAYANAGSLIHRFGSDLGAAAGLEGGSLFSSSTSL